MKAGADPHGVKDKDGKSVYEVQTPEIRDAIDKFTLFCNRFEIISVSNPEHATATSVVLRATDKRPADAGTASDVVLKLMMYEDQFDNEIMQRKLTKPKYVVEVICTSADGTL